MTALVEYVAAVAAACGGNLSETARRLGTHRRSVQRILINKVAPR